MIVAGAAVTLTLTGCYEHVVRQEGFGQRGTSIHEPNAPDADGELSTPLNPRDRQRTPHWQGE